MTTDTLANLWDASTTPAGSPQGAQVDSLANLWDTTAPSTKKEAVSLTKGAEITPGNVEAGMKAFTQLTPAASRLPTKDMAKSLLAFVDNTIGGVIPYGAKQIGYLFGRTIGDTPEQAEKISNRLAEITSKPFGKAFGISNDPAYKGEAVGKLFEFVGENIHKGSKFVADKTGLPASDIEWMANTVLPKAIEKGAPLVAKGGKKVVEVGGKVKAELDVAKAQLEGKTAGQLKEQFEQKAAPETVAPEIKPAEVVAPEQVVEPVVKQEPVVAQMNEQFQAKQPQVAKVVEDVTAQGGEVNPQAVALHDKALSLPVPIELTKGQALQDPVIISRERNERGIKEQLSQRFNEQNKALQENATIIKQQAAPDVKTTDYVGDSQFLIDNIGELAKANETRIGEAYQKLKDQAGGKFPMDGQTASKQVLDQLKEADRLDYLPEIYKKKLEAYANGTKQMNFNLFENLRSDLAADMRKADRAGDGVTKNVLSQVRDGLETMELKGDAQSLKGFADDARAAFKAEKDLEASNPLYAKVKDGAADTKNFIPEVVIRSKNKDFAKSMELIADNPQARQNLASGTLDWIIRDSTDASGNLSTAKFNKHIEALRLNGRLEPIFGDQAANLANLVEVGRAIEARPRGAFVNESNTVPAGAALIKENAPALIKSIPYVGEALSIGKEMLEKRKTAKEVKETLEPGAGIKVKQSGKNKPSDFGIKP